ncbi:MAG: hypothetical protein KGL39_15555 [Patescibacteria group bacterium]|nr:hypothetical protein [Patescibacteria group bacterium]
MKTYSTANDAVMHSIERMRKEHHDYLDGVTVGALFIFDNEDSSEPVLKHGGYPAYAYVRITPLRDRAAGMPDAMIVVDRACWMTLGTQGGHALMDHELTHLERIVDKETGGGYMRCDRAAETQDQKARSSIRLVRRGCAPSRGGLHRSAPGAPADPADRSTLLRLHTSRGAAAVDCGVA